MSHELWDRDNLVLFKQPAWHKIGVVVDKAPSPLEALHIAKADFEIEQVSMNAQQTRLLLGPDNDPVEETRDLDLSPWVANVRSDTGEVFAVVGKGYGVVQNRDLVNLIYAAAGNEEVTVESAGTLRNGREVFFLCHLNTFSLGTMDRVHQYALVCNTHDATARLKVLPTDIRVVCANTKTWATSTAKRAGYGIAIKHSANIMERLGEVQGALRGVTTAARAQAEEAVALSERTMGAAEVKAFFLGVYQKLYGTVEENPTARGPKAKRTRAIEMVSQWFGNLNREASELGHKPTAWLAANAVSRWVDHQRPTRTDRTYSNLLGTAAAAKDTAYDAAMALLA